MGASGVKKGLRPVSRPVCVYSDFADQRLAVDISIVLYRLAYWYRAQVQRGELDLIVQCVWRRMQRFLASGVFPLPVFDGALLPGKEDEHERRQERKCRAVAAALKLSDPDALLKARVAVTEELVLAVQREFHRHGLVFLVAPYEVDPQLAREFHSGRVHAVLSEDSDLPVSYTHLTLPTKRIV
eukprot:TRINITY_DN11275_c0_g1_i1.p1 TRINITY_DN11275_c0_g1~~TRINITY_DN11275_c0_g1_i1.p1  ORF type:complete len:184 (-),score=35.25 TRINITY_DN11275_c0_g1_i1:68-619(-)